MSTPERFVEEVWSHRSGPAIERAAVPAEGECDTHDWLDVLTSQSATRVAFRFCTVCDREEYEDGSVRPGYAR